MQLKFFALAIALLIELQLNDAAPTHTVSNDLDSNTGNNAAVDYNTVMGHFKDFFMYMPVMMTTLKETMTGFPKFAEGIRILASKNGRLDNDDDCKCKQSSSNEISPSY